jgi:phosphatidylglycerophosphatase C
MTTENPPTVGADRYRPEADRRALAVFDLDGTLTRRDTLLPFVVSYAWRHRSIRPLIALPMYLCLYACRLLSDRSAKERILVSFFRGQSKTNVSAHADWFCKTWLPNRLCDVVVGKLREHQKAGHRVVLLSASPDIYVPAIARELGISEVICTRVAGDDTTWHGSLVGPNYKGAAKLDRLQEYLGRKVWPGSTYAYGDQSHDVPVLQWVQNGFLVSRKSELVRV